MGHESLARTDRPDSVNVAPELIFAIARLELEPGDILVVKGPVLQRAPDLSFFLPHRVRVLYIPPEVELSVLTKAEVEHLLNPSATLTESGTPPAKDPS